jgi:uncharacterized cupin superfamily protein
MKQKRIDVGTVAPVVGTLYPSPFDQPCRARQRRKLGDAAGLTQFGVNLLTLPPGAWSSQRHWHKESDEFIYVLAGEVTLVTNGGEEVLHAGDAAGFKAGDTNGHCLQNRSQTDARILEIGTRIPNDAAYYPDIDMIAPSGGKPARYTHGMAPHTRTSDAGDLTSESMASTLGSGTSAAKHKSLRPHLPVRRIPSSGSTIWPDRSTRSGG